MSNGLNLEQIKWMEKLFQLPYSIKLNAYVWHLNSQGAKIAANHIYCETKTQKKRKFGLISFLVT